MASKDEKKTAKVLIQEIGETSTPMELEGEEQTIKEEQSHGSMQQQYDSQSNKAASKDLLRLEKNYFDKVYNEESHGNQKAFVVSKMMVEAPVKPNFQAMPISSIKDRLNSFLPSFKKDTDDLLVNPERQEAMRIDDRNMYEEEEENKNKEENEESSSDDDNEDDEVDQQEQQLRQHQIDLAELKANEKEASKRNKNENTDNNNNQQPKVIQLDLLLGVLDVKMPETQDQKE